MDSNSFPRSASGTACATRARFPLTKATRRDVRRHVAFAAELGIYSVTLHNVVWTLNQKVQHCGPKRQDDPPSCKGQGGANSHRSERSTRRLQDFQRAVRFRLASFFKQWKQQGALLSPLPALQQPSSTVPLPALPLPMPEAASSQPKLQLQQPREREDDGRATKRDAAASRSWATTPSTPPAKRMLALPPGLPPPSAPPSPPSPLPSPPPPQGEESSPEPSSNQTPAVNDQVGREGGASGDSAGCPPVRNDTNNFVKSNPKPEKPAAPHSSRAGCRPGRVPVPRQCTAWCEEHVDCGWVVEELGFQCDQCFKEGFGDDDLSDISVTRWKSTKMGFRCEACHHVLPWLHDEVAGLCHKCWRKSSVPDEMPGHKA